MKASELKTPPEPHSGTTEERLRELECWVDYFREQECVKKHEHLWGKPTLVEGCGDGMIAAFVDCERCGWHSEAHLDPARPESFADFQTWIGAVGLGAGDAIDKPVGE